MDTIVFGTGPEHQPSEASDTSTAAERRPRQWSGHFYTHYGQPLQIPAQQYQRGAQGHSCEVTNSV